MSAYVIAVDNGSQSTKVSIVDADGAIHASARVPLRPYASPAPGRWEHPDDDLWTSIVAATRAALEAFPGDPADIRALGLCTIRFCRAVLREDGSLAQPVMSWMDERVSLPFRAETPDARFVTTSSGYITRRLTGVLRDTAGNQQGVWPIDAASWAWSTEPADFDRTGMTREMLAELVLPGDVLGVVGAEAAAATGLPAGLPVVATSNDKAVEALGAGLRSEDEALVSLGTYVAAMMVGSSGHAPAGDHWVNFASEPHRYLFESAGTRRGMWTVSWFRDLVSGFGADGARDAVGVPPGAAGTHGGGAGDPAAVLAALTEGAAEVEPGAGGLVVSLDWLAPPDEPHRRGAIVGFDGTQGRFHVYRAILESLAISTALNAERMAAALGRGIREVVVTGGGASSPLVLEILAATFGVPVRRPLVTDAAGTGAAVCAAVAAGLHPSWDAAVAAMVRPGERVEPDPDLVADYAAVRRRYEHVIPRARALFDGAPPGP